MFAEVNLKEQRSRREEGGGGGQNNASVSTTQCIGGLEWSLGRGETPNNGNDDERDSEEEEVRYVWIGEECLALTNMMLVYNSVDWFQYKPSSKSWHEGVNNTSRTLKRRYFLVEKSKETSIVGIVVGTLSISGYMDALNSLRRIIAEAGKKSYTFVMGRITPEKMANYPEIEVFVLISCPQLALLDSRDFYAPVITPFEAELAFIPDRTWTGSYSIGFESLRTSSEAVKQSDKSPANGDGEEATQIQKGKDIETNIIKQATQLQLSEGKWSHPLFF